ncbi:hypothetical protein AB0F88_44175 [Streptosporangium sp. NPDC023963]|uniref:hypothetical protein n=1 Tax=Streptosporangium sp. NPDC023963 TaxID=3155608 RepID=UPI00344269B2
MEAALQGGEHDWRIVMRMAQLVGLLDLADTDVTDMLRERLAVVDPGADDVLTAEEEAAYQHPVLPATVIRINAMWSLGSPLARSLYWRAWRRAAGASQRDTRG